MKRMVVVALAALAFSAAAADAVVGLGASMSCGDWTAERASPRDSKGSADIKELAMVSWIQGYASGMNMGYANLDKRKMVDFVSYNSIVSWVDTYCKANPFDSLFVATTLMVGDLRVRQGIK